MSFPIIQYEFSDTNLGQDYSGNGFDLVNNGVVLDTIGGREDVADFNGSGSGFASISNVPSSVNGSNPRTFMLWVYLVASSSQSQNQFIFEYGTTNPTKILRVFYTSGSGSGRGIIFNTEYGNTTPIDPGFGWSHLAFAYEASNVRIYINGVERANSPTQVDAGDSVLYIGYSGIFSGTSYWRGAMSDFRVYDAALSESEIISASQTSVVYPDPLSTIPWSTLTESSWRAVDGAVSYRLTIDSGSGESTILDNTTSLEHVEFNLEPTVAYTFRLYSSTDGVTYSLAEEGSVSTLADTAANSNFEIFLTNGVYDTTALNDATRTRLGVHLNDVLTTGDEIRIDNPVFIDKSLTIVTNGSTSTIPGGNIIIFPFNATGGNSQNATLQLSDNSSTVVTFDASTNEIGVGGTTYSPGDKFVLDGKKVTVHDVI